MNVVLVGSVTSLKVMTAFEGSASTVEKVLYSRSNLLIFVFAAFTADPNFFAIACPPETELIKETFKTNLTIYI